jgi:anthranilate synthase
MAVEHQRLPIAAMQFHPESVMTLREEVGMPIIAAVMSALAPYPPGTPCVSTYSE